MICRWYLCIMISYNSENFFQHVSILSNRLFLKLNGICKVLPSYSLLTELDNIASSRNRRNSIFLVRLRKSRHANLCSKNQFFGENVVIIAFSELRPGSNERYENSTFYGPFSFFIFIHIFNKKQFYKSVYQIQTSHFTYFFYEVADIQNYSFIK